MGLFDFENKKRERERAKQEKANRIMEGWARNAAGGGWWTCPRCGTTNPNNGTLCKQCRNRKPN